MIMAAILANAATISARIAAANPCKTAASSTTEEHVWNVSAATNSKAECVPSKAASNRNKVSVLSAKKTTKKSTKPANSKTASNGKTIAA